MVLRRSEWEETGSSFNLSLSFYKGEKTGKSHTLLWPQFLFLVDEKQTLPCQGFRILSLFVGTALGSKHRKFPNHMKRKIGL